MSNAHQLRRDWIEKLAMWMLQVSKIRVFGAQKTRWNILRDNQRAVGGSIDSAFKEFCSRKAEQYGAIWQQIVKENP